MTRVVIPPDLSPDELEALIREARDRQRRRQLLFAGAVAVVAAVGLSVWAAVPGRGGRNQAANGGPTAAATRGIDNAGRVPIVEVGTSGGVTWAINGIGMWLTTNGGRTWRASLPPHVAAIGDAIARVQQVQFLDPRRGWLLAVDVTGGLRPSYRRHGELDWTSDGGRTWHWTMPKGCCGEFTFLNRRVGFFVGDSRFYATRNAGTSWQPVGAKFFGGPLTFVDARHGVTLLDGGLLWTADGGGHWKDVLLSGEPAAAGNSTVVGGPVERVGRRLVLIAAHNFSKATNPGRWRDVPYFSDDGGAIWTPRPLPSWFVRSSRLNGRGYGFSAVNADVWFLSARRQLAVTNGRRPDLATRAAARSARPLGGRVDRLHEREGQIGRAHV